MGRDRWHRITWVPGTGWVLHLAPPLLRWH